MSLITEDGTGLVTAESYISVIDCATYFANRGITNWATITTAQQEQALRRATDYMIGEFRNRWAGFRVNRTQALDWPRFGVIMEDGQGVSNGYGTFVVPYTIVPVEVQKACAELAIRAAAGELRSDNTKEVLEERVGTIIVKYDPNSRAKTIYEQINAMVRVYLKTGGNNSVVKLVRS